jgi:transcription elongation factor SPT6
MINILSGVDINQAVLYPHKRHTLQFVSGLGPRKAQAMVVKISRTETGKLESRANLVKQQICAARIFMNCSSFIRVRRYHFFKRRSSEDMWDVLDDTRIHPEDYELARKMAADAIEVDESTLDEEDNPSQHVQELMDGDVQRLNLLLLEDYAEELEKTIHQPKKICLNEIKDELMAPYRERRRRYEMMTADELFQMLTGETNETMYVDMITTAIAKKVMERGVRVTLASGLDGYIHVKNLSDRRLDDCNEEVRTNDTIECRILSIDKEKFIVDLSAKPRDVEESRKMMQKDTFGVTRDNYFCIEWERGDVMEKEAEKRKASQKQQKKINHQYYQAVDFRGAEAYLRMRPAGELVVRPSTKGPTNLSITWKVDESVYQHIGNSMKELNF